MVPRRAHEVLIGTRRASGPRATTGALLLLALLAAAGASSVQASEAPVASRQHARIAGATLTYTAEIGRLPIRDVETGEPRGYMGYVSYRVPVKRGRTPRPVTFVWNGGPGANSSLLHFFTAGPRRVEGAQLVDNEDSWLSATDLVMVDPIGTGFSRPAKPEYAAEFYSTRGDVASITEFVRSWLLLNEADNAPLFLAGESWGAGRAAQVAHALLSRGRRVDGIVLISGGWGLNTELIPTHLRRALEVVDMASAALFHGRSAPELGSDPEQLRRAAEAFARGTYAPALARVMELTPRERDAIASELARYTGIDAEAIDRKTLVIAPRQFRTGLLAHRGETAYVFDLRRTSPPGEAGRAAMLRYLRRDLGFRTDLSYVGLEPASDGYAANGTYPASVGARWDYATAAVTAEERSAAMAAAAAAGSGPPRLGPPLPATAEALAVQPRLRVHVAAGLYDSFLACASGAETERQLPSALRDAIRFKCYGGGHAMYEDAAVRAELARDLRALFSWSAQ